MRNSDFVKHFTFWVFISFLPSSLIAETYNLQLESFEPFSGQKNHILNVQKAKTIGNENFEIGVFTHYAKESLLVEFDDNKRVPWIDHQISTEFFASLGFGDYFEIGFTLPLIISRSINSKLEEQNLGTVFLLSDTRIQPRIELPLKNENWHLGIAATLYLPSATPGDFTGYGSFRSEARFIVEYQSTDFLLASNLSYQSYKARSFLDHVDGGQLRSSFGAELPINETLSVLGSAYIDLPLEKGIEEGRAWKGEIDSALRLSSSKWSILLGGGFGLTDAPGVPLFRIFSGLSFSNGNSKLGDQDGDRVPHDKCPDQAEDFDNFQDQDGCPEKDNDSDGIQDDQDKCPMDAEDFDGFKDQDGCPDLDNDGDGVLDLEDDCPDEKGSKSNAGCSLDSDGDGIRDALDKCKDVAEDLDDFEDEDGCPDVDNDNDGILDINDVCPNSTRSGIPDETGCIQYYQVKPKIIEKRETP